MKRFCFLLLAVTACMTAQAASCRAESPDRAALMHIARQFVEKVGTNLKNADNLLGGKDSDEIRMEPHYDSLADGDVLLLQLNLSRQSLRDPSRMRFADPILAIKQGRDVMISLTDFFFMASFPIQVNAETGLAEGWFIREEQRFRLDAATGTARVKDQTFQLAPGDVLTQDNDIFVKGKTLAAWFELDMLVNPQAQGVNIKTAQDWPVQEKEMRARRLAAKPEDRKPKQPFRKEPYSLAPTVPDVDVSIRGRVRRVPDREVLHQLSYNTTAKSELLRHALRATTSTTDDQGLESLRANFSRMSEEDDLLGPLKANFYEFNDVSTVSVPLAGTAPPERGVHVTNKHPYITYDTSTQIEVDAPPGWDVELYREQSFIDGGTAELTGIHTFTDVPLFAGQNRFRIVKYGPQGEVEEEERIFSVTAAAYEKGLYNVSLTEKGGQTYKRIQSRNTDNGTPHLAATYEKQYSDTTVLRTGIQARQEHGDFNTYLYGGTASILDERTIFNTDAVVTNDAAFVAGMTARRNYGRHSLLGAGRYTSADYLPDARASRNVPAYFTGNLFARGPLYGSNPKTRVDYTANTSVTLRDNGDQLTQTGLGLSRRFGRTLVNNTVTYKSENREGPHDRRELTDVFAVRGRVGDVNWRATANTRLMPDARFRKAVININRYFSPTIQGELDLQHDTSPVFTSGTATMNMRTEKAIISPSVSYDSEDVLTMLMNVRFGINRNPYTSDVSISGLQFGDKGGVSVFVFLDKNGDGAFSADDEPLPDVIVESVQNHKIATTNAEGEAFLHDLPGSRVTDITVQESSAFDINWVTGTPGVSVRPRPGHIARVVFPVHRGGEVSGTAYAVLSGGRTQVLRNLGLYLYDRDGRAVRSTVTAYDGYYLMERVPPGDYYLMINSEDAENNRLVRPLPQEIHIGYEGAVIAGNDLLFRTGPGDVALSIAPDLSDWLAANPGVDMSAAAGDEVILNLGSFNSRLLMTLTWYRLKREHGGLLGGAELLLEPGDSNNSAKTGKNVLRARLPGATAREAYKLCQTLSLDAFACAVEMMPRSSAQAEDGKAGAAPKG